MLLFFLLLKICIRFDYSAITLKYQNFFKLRDKKNISNYFEYEYLFFFYFYQTIPVYLVITDQRQRRGLYDVRHYPCLKSRSRVSRIKTRVWTPQVWHTVRNQSLKFEHRWQSFKENSTNVVLKHAQKNPLTSPLRYPPPPKMNRRLPIPFV